MNNHTSMVSCTDARMKSYHSLSLPQIEKVFNDTDMMYLEEMYSFLYAQGPLKITKISRFYIESKLLSVHGMTLITNKARSQRLAAIVAHWRGRNGIDATGQSPLRVGIVTSFFKHELHVIDTGSNHEMCKNILLARVTWFQNHPRRDQYIPTVIVCSTLPDTESCASFIPVSRIAARCAIVKKITVY